MKVSYSNTIIINLLLVYLIWINLKIEEPLEPLEKNEKLDLAEPDEITPQASVDKWNKPGSSIFKKDAAGYFSKPPSKTPRVIKSILKPASG